VLGDSYYTHGDDDDQVKRLGSAPRHGPPIPNVWYLNKHFQKVNLAKANLLSVAMTLLASNITGKTYQRTKPIAEC